MVTMLGHSVGRGEKWALTYLLLSVSSPYSEPLSPPNAERSAPMRASLQGRRRTVGVRTAPRRFLFEWNTMLFEPALMLYIYVACMKLGSW